MGGTILDGGADIEVIRMMLSKVERIIFSTKRNFHSGVVRPRFH